MEKTKNRFKKAFFYGICLTVYALAGVTNIHGQVNLNTDGSEHSIAYVHKKYQDAEIPSNVSYDYLFLSAVGGDGGYKRLVNSVKKHKNVPGGRGALVQGYFKIGYGEGEIPPGSTIRFIVGQRGEEESNIRFGGGGGGGGTGIAYKGPGSEKWKLLMVAGGGSGAYGDCCSFKKSGSGTPGRAYTLGQNVEGYRKFKNLDSDTKKNHVGNSAYGGPEYGTNDIYDKYNKAGWRYGPDAGEPTGNGSYRKSGKPRGGWGFGPGGSGDNISAFGGGGGGYRGGSLNESKSKQNHGGYSFVADSMKVEGIFSRERGKTDQLANGSVVYRFTNELITWKIRSVKESGKCINVANNKTTPDTNINLKNCNNFAHQRWLFVNNSIISSQGKCLDLKKEDSANGSSIQLYDCNISDTQKWIYDGLTRQVRNKGNWNKCLDAPGYDPRNTNIRIWDCEDRPGQQWEIDGAITAEGNNRVKTVNLAKDNGKCMDVYGGKTANGTNVQLWNCHGQNPQKWLFDGITIRYNADPGKCLDLDHRNTKNGNIQLWECNGTEAQRWVYDGLTGSIRYWADFSKCLVPRESNIEIGDCNDKSDQRWKLKEGYLFSDKAKTIKRFKDINKCVDVHGGRTANGTNIQLWHCTDNTNQQWTYDGLYLRYKKDPTKCLDLKDANAHRGTNIQLYTCNGTKAQRWLYDQKEHKIRYAANWGKCLEVYRNKNVDGTNIQIYDCRDTDAQKWVIERQ